MCLPEEAMDIEPQLQHLFERYESDLGAYVWMLYETDRWAELGRLSR
jgi:hypothetical protein